MFTKIAIIGTGNVGTWLFKILQNQKNLEVFSFSSRKIETLSQHFDLYIFALKDDIYEDVLQQIPFKMSHAVHTSGSLSQNILAPYSEKFGVLYPYQSITKTDNTLNPYLSKATLVAEEQKSRKAEKEKGERRKEEGGKEEDNGRISLSNFEGVLEGRGNLYIEIPICVEGSDSVFEDLLYQWANSIFNIVHKINEKQRFAMHLAAVFANNFTNAMYEVAYQIFKENDLDWSLIFPLLDNTLEKAKHHAPHLVQTGPAKRGDVSIMEKHCNALNNEDFKILYRMVSKIISKTILNPSVETDNNL